AADMGEIGAKLDKDFGISKGLAGVAENLFKFLADLAFAPALGAMRGAQAGLGFPNGSGGSGLFSIAADMGAFGPDMVPTSPYAQRSSTATGGGLQAVLGPGGTVSMAAPQGGRVPYGLPAGTNTGGYGSSGAVFPDWVHQIESTFGIK